MQGVGIFTEITVSRSFSRPAGRDHDGLRDDGDGDVLVDDDD